jgi:hypothetical protein
MMFAAFDIQILEFAAPRAQSQLTIASQLSALFLGFENSIKH